MAMSAAVTMMGAGMFMQYQGNKAAGASAQALGAYNAAVGEMKAKDAEYRGLVAEFDHRTNTRRLVGSQRAAFGASGVMVDDAEGTTGQIVQDTMALSEQDALTIRYNAAREAWGYRVGAQEDMMRGGMAKREYDNKAVGGVLSTAGNVLFAKYGFKG